MTILYVIGAFIAGMLFYKVCSALAIIFGLKSQLLHVVENEIIEFALTVYSRLIMSLETGYITMRTSGVSEEAIKRIRNEDEHDLREWKKEVMEKFVDSYPNVYKDMLSVRTWEDAMKQLTAYKEFPEEASRDENSA
tara:strand:+ start:11284 stop:11694 length:411 start_codon:yes stop_codon:yes gene_type:complete